MKGLAISETWKSILLLGLMVIIVFFPATLLNHTYGSAYNFSRFPVLDLTRDYGCKENCGNLVLSTIDPGADGEAIWPVAHLAAKLYSQEILPLWNPYLAAGTPLAADTINFAFSPMMVFYLLPNSYWDIPILVSVWLAGIFAYLLLKSWNLSFVSSLSGGTIFMLSGVFTWYLTHDSIMVIMFTPLILFSIEKVFQSKDFKYVILGSAALAASILGGHLESIVLVLLLCSVYAAFRILYEAFSKYKKQDLSEPNENRVVIAQSKKRIILKIFVILLGGLGLSAFFIIPATEYVFVGGAVGRDTNTGISATTPIFTIATTFLPYFLGPVQVYTIPKTAVTGFWNGLGGYVAASSLVFSLIGITFSNRSTQSNLHKRTAQFFFAIAIFFLLKSFGTPIINMIGVLPILDHIVFPRYDGFIWTIGLAVSAAFGIEVLVQQKIRTKHLAMVTVIAAAIIIVMTLPLIPYLTWEHLVADYVIFQILQGLFFVLMAFLLIWSFQRDGHSISRIFLLLFAELSLYIPMGLDPIWQFYRSIVVMCGIVSLCVVSFLPPRLTKIQNMKLKIFVVIVSLIIAGQVIVYLESPGGLRLRSDAFEDTPVTEFLKQNIGNSRMFSFDIVAFRPNSPAAHQIQTIGIISAQNVNVFSSFVHNILDPYVTTTIFDYDPSWRSTNSPSTENLFVKNIKYYDFLGVKYIVGHGTDPNKIAASENMSVSSFPMVFNQGGFVIYENKDVFPRAFLVGKYQTANSYIEAQHLIMDPSFDLRNEAVIENDLSPEQASQVHSSPNNNAEITMYSPNKVIIHTNSDTASLLVLTDTFYPGWQAYVDGKETKIYRADGLVRAIFVPQGEHQIVFSYLPKSFVVGVVISSVTTIFLIGVFYYVGNKNKKTNANN